MTAIWRNVLILGLWGAATSSAFAAVKVAAPAPDFQVKTLKGKTESLASLHGKVVILTFWATWCTPCRGEMAAFEAYYAKHHDDGLEIVAIDQDDPDNADKVRQLMSSYTFDAAFDSQSSHDRYGRVSELPVSIVIDRNGIVRADSRQGAWVFDAARLESTITPLLAK